MLNFILRLAITMLALKGADLLLPNFDLGGDLLSLFWFSLVLGILNWIVKPVLVFFSTPLILITVGFFYLLINAFLIYFASVLFPGILHASTAGIFFGSICVSILHWILTILFRVKKS